MLMAGGYDSILTVSATDLKFHPLKQLVMEVSSVHYYDQNLGPEVVTRQQLTPLFHRNGVAYVLTRDCILNQRNLIGRNSSALELHEHLVNIDTYHDLELANELIANRV